MAKTGLSFDQLETAFRHGNFKPLYFLFGEEGYLLDELQALLVEQALQPHERDFNLDVVYGAEADAPAVLALCGSYPVMAQRRIVLVRDFEKLKQNRLFTTFAEHPNPQAVVMLVCKTRPNLSAHPYRALKEHAAWGEFKPLYDNQMPGWVQRYVQAQGREMEPQAVQMLVEFVGNNLQAAAAEVEKLITFTGAGRTLTGDDVIRAGGQTRDYNVFELQRMIGAGKYPEALRITERLLQQASAARSEALMIVSVLTAYFTKLWKLSACQGRRLPEQAMARRIGVSVYFLKEYLFSLRRFGASALEAAFGALLAADFELKGGSSRDERLVLTLLLRRLIPEADPKSAAG